MTDETLEEFTRQYIACQPREASEINFTWQGGEPTLMGIDFFKRALFLQKKYNRSGMEIINSIQTNGTLIDDEWAVFLKDNNFLVGISIDGPQELHDKFRKDKVGKGSFRNVMNGLEALKRNGTDFNTLTVVQSDNGNYPVEIYKFLKEIGSEYIQFIPIVEVNDGAVSSRTVLPKQWGNFLCSVFDEWQKEDIGRIFVQHFDLFLSRYCGYPSSLCSHAPYCGRAVAIEHDGSLYSCDHFVYPDNRLGNIDDNTLTNMIDSPFQMNFGKSKHSALPGLCLECEYLALCYGGCPSDRCKKTAVGESGLNWNCEGYKRFYKHSQPVFTAMREALRNGKTADKYRTFMMNSSLQKNKKIGRNDPCPCGSGKKYKHCHGQ
jgi:uncharacterized protein